MKVTGRGEFILGVNFDKCLETYFLEEKSIPESLGAYGCKSFIAFSLYCEEDDIYDS
ncbi:MULTISPECIES: hypothetical protein [Paenibacillus]|uniref:Uncharacterized protein n=1 Tax=Paenibacillus violae TaxID=3077234 RepID=A0ABU3RPR9_9BACL|nr:MULTISPECIES: hypothetical protein [Paenibacillus]MDU0205842.1 hypothetical protein [Paenibacillus sp. PFR10]MEC0269676.1 hypothetical protein [Paenibacillus anseongense]